MRAVVVLPLLLFLASCRTGSDAGAKQTDTPVGNDLSEETWGNARPSNYIDLDAWRDDPYSLATSSNERGLTLTQHSVGGDEDTYYVQVTLTNHGAKEAYVLPITPVYYQFEAKLVPSGTVEPLVTLPPVDPPMPNESTLVKLYPRNSISAVFALKKSWRRRNATYRVVGFGHMELTVDGVSTLVPFDVKSIWSPGK